MYRRRRRRLRARRYRRYDGRLGHHRRPIRSFIPAAAVGCVGGIVAIGALGVLAGQILVTAPVAIGAAIQYFTTLGQSFNAPAK